MTKRVNTDEIDESFVIASVKKGRPVQVISSPSPAPLPATVANRSEPSPKTETPEPSESPTEDTAVLPEFPNEDTPVSPDPPKKEISVTPELLKDNTPVLPDSPKEEPRSKRERQQEYESLFIRESNITARLGKTVYIRREYHDRILKIVQVIGGNEISLFSYIDNMIAHHFETFQDEMTQSYKRKNRDLF